MDLLNILWLAVAFVVVVFVLPSIRIIGPTEVGLVTKRFSFRRLPDDNPIAFHGEAGYQADLLMPGWRLKFWVVYAVEKHPWVQVRAGEIGVVVAQVGRPLPIGAKSAESVAESEPFDQPAGMAGGRRAKGRAATRAPARQPHAGPSGRLPGDYPRAHLRRSRGPRLPAVAVPRPAHLRIVWTSGRPPEGHGHHAAIDRQRRHHRHLRHRHHVRRPAVAGRRHRQPARRVRRHQEAGKRRARPLRC